MAQSVLQILIKMAREGNADKETIYALKNIEKGIKDTMAVVGALGAAWGVLDKVVIQNTMRFKDYALAMVDGARVTGTTVEQYSRLTQAADDVRISQESLTKSLQFAAKSGFDTSTQSLMRYADEYNKLGSASQKAEFLAKRFGKSGLEMGKLLEQGSDGINKATESISESLVVTNKQAAEAVNAAKAMDSFKDATEGVGNVIGASFLPKIADLINDLAKLQPIEERALDLMKRLSVEGNKSRATAGMEQELEALKKTPEYAAYAAKALADFRNEERNTGSSQADATAAAEAQVKTFDKLFGTVQDLTTINRDYAATVLDIKLKKADLTNQINALISQGYSPQGRAISELKAQYDAYDVQLADAAKAQEDASRRMIFAMEQQKLAADGLTDSEFNYLLKLGEAWGIIDTKSATQAKNVDKARGLLEGLNVAGGTFAMVMDQIMKLPADKEITLSLIMNMVQQATSGGSNNPSAAAGEQGIGAQGNSSNAYSSDVGYTQSGSANAAGGWAANMALVGDRPGGVPTSYSEIVQWTPRGNYVYNASQTRAMLSSGMRFRAYPTGGVMPSEPGQVGAWGTTSSTSSNPTGYVAPSQYAEPGAVTMAGVSTATAAQVAAATTTVTAANAATTASVAAASAVQTSHAQTQAVLQSSQAISSGIDTLNARLARLATKDDIQAAMSNAVQLLPL